MTPASAISPPPDVVGSSEPTFVDTHVHLDEAAFAGDVDAVVWRARDGGVRQLVNIAYRPSRWASSMLLMQRFAGVSVAAGLHPGHVDEYTDQTVADLDRALDRLQAVAIGEIGVDHFRHGFDAVLQKRAFTAQIELAESRALPVVIHQRAAESDCIQVLREAAQNVTVVLHSFDGTWELGRLGIDRGYYFGVGGLMTRGGAQLVRDILAHVPADRLLLETDAPYLTPNGIKVRRNEPANIPFIAEKLAALRGVEVAEIARITTSNARGVFGLARDAAGPEMVPAAR